MKIKSETICILCNSKLNSVLTNTIRGGKKRNVYYCPKCDIAVLGGGFQEGNAEIYYKKKYWQNHSPKLGSGIKSKELFDIYSKFQGERLKLLRPFFSKKKKLLEIGCSSGMFLYHVRKEFKEVIGLDYNESSAKYAAKVCRCKTYFTDIINTPIPKTSLDIVCAFQTLEHVNDPIKFLKTVEAYLKPGGIIAIEVPNLYDALASLYNLPNYYEFYFHDAHLWYFSEKSLLNIMRKTGFVGKIYFLQDYNVLNHLHWADVDTPAPKGVLQLAPPSLPLRTTVSKAARREVTRKLGEFNTAYKETLARHKLTSNLFFIGKKIK